MWVLKSAKGESVYLVPGEFVVGRKNCDIVLEGDQSISKRHAIITVSHPHCNLSDPNKLPQVQITDAGSKYGSTIHSANKNFKMEKDVKHVITTGDEVHFGLQWNKWVLTFEPLVVIFSTLPKADKNRVKALIGGLGGHVVSEWNSQVSHLTMSSITLTVKAVCALAYGKPIVSPDYWEAYKKAVDAKCTLPNHEEYVPVLGETVLNRHQVSFLANPERRILFKGKTFYFFSEPQFKDHGCLVEAAGGVPKYISDLVKSKKMFIKPNSVVMQLLSMNSQSLSLSASEAPEGFTEVAAFIKSEGKRLIPASEIGLAILHCSLEKFCNPDYAFSNVFLNRVIDNTQPKDHGQLIASETQTQSSEYISKDLMNRGKIIPDSGTESKFCAVSVIMSTSTVEASETQDLDNNLLQSVKPSTQNFSETHYPKGDSQERWRCQSADGPSGLKRARIVESDDEVEILPPPKQRHSSTRSNVQIVDLDDDKETHSSVSQASNSGFRSSGCRLNISNVSISKDSNDADDLFTDFQDYESLPMKKKPIIETESSEVNAESLFSDFQDYDTVSKQKPELGDKSKMKQSVIQFLKPARSVSTKRSNFSENEYAPPEKRLAKLNISKPKTSGNYLLQVSDSDDDEEEEDYKENTFLSVDVKKEEVSGISSKLSNGSVFFKPLMVSRNNSTVSSMNNSADKSHYGDTPNFKKFKKVCNAPIIPHIIGGSDLVAYNSSVNIDQVQDLSEESEGEEERCQWLVNFREEKTKTFRGRARQL